VATTSSGSFNCNDEFDSWDKYEVPVSQTVSGNVVNTLVRLGTTNVLLRELVIYSPGTSYFTILASVTGASAKIYIGGEEDPYNSEKGYDYHNAANGAVGGYNPWNGSYDSSGCSGTPTVGVPNYYIGEVPLSRAAHWVVGSDTTPNDDATGAADYPDAFESSGCNDLGFGLEWIGNSALTKFTFGSKAP